ncbi:MAG: Nif3-like dinuclear metal center hexameric protein [Thermodesulfobacteriota bacterium]|nr:Nif3-like dinuclear metal center hexameric protein [Thermodesulfobacteriota bacterium]
MRLRGVLEILDRMAPFDTAEEWDNSGIMVGDRDKEIHRVLVSLDPGLDTIAHAREMGHDLIITHHPLFFHPIRHLDLADGVSKKACMLICSDIALVSMHTNLDKAPGGVADCLAGFVHLRGIKTHGMLRSGHVEGARSLEKWAGSLGFPHARLADAHRRVDHVAVCPGSGMDLWSKALDLGCDTYITGDVKYHDAIDASEAGLNIVDPGHFGTEQIAIGPLAQRLTTLLDGMDVDVFRGKDVFNWIDKKE